MEILVTIVSPLLTLLLVHKLPFWSALSTADALVSAIDFLQIWPVSSHVPMQQSMPKRLLLLALLSLSYITLSIVFWTDRLSLVFQWLALALASSTWLQNRLMGPLEVRATSVSLNLLAQIAASVLVLDSPNLDFETTRSRMFVLLGGTWTWPRLLQQCLWPDKGWKELCQFILVLRNHHPMVMSLITETGCLYTMGSLFNHLGVGVSSLIFYCKKVNAIATDTLQANEEEDNNNKNSSNSRGIGLDPTAGHQPSQNLGICLLIHSSAFVFSLPIWLHVSLVQLCPLFYQYLPWKQYLQPREIRLEIAISLAYCFLGQQRLWTVMLSQGVVLAVLEHKPHLFFTSLVCAAMGQLSDYHPLQLAFLCLVCGYYGPAMVEACQIYRYTKDQQIGTWMSQIIEVDDQYFASTHDPALGPTWSDQNLPTGDRPFRLEIDTQQWGDWKRRTSERPPVL